MPPGYKYDVFISHAFEDKIDLGNSLSTYLRKAGLKVWYSGTEMRVGEDLTPTILRKVIPCARFGVVIISNSYFKAEWGRRELNALHSFERSRGYNVILPIWHNVDDIHVKNEFPYLIDRFALRSDKGIEHISNELIKVITEAKRKARWKFKEVGIKILGGLILTCAIAFLFQLISARYFKPDLPLNSDISLAVQKHIRDINELVNSEITHQLSSRSGRLVSFEDIKDVFTGIAGTNGLCPSSTFVFSNFTEKITGRRKLALLGFDFKSSSLYSAYGLKDFSSFILDSPLRNSCLRFTLINKREVQYTIGKVNKFNEFQASVSVSYEEALRSVNEEVYQVNQGTKCSMKLTLLGLKPNEELIYEKQGNKWVCTGLR